MYGLEWLIVLGLLGLTAGGGAGFLIARRSGAGGARVRQLEADLETARQEHADYRQEVVGQFRETARKFQTLNDSYTDLHAQLARSASVLCGDASGPLLAAPAGHQDLLPAGSRGDAPPATVRRSTAEAGPSAQGQKEPSAEQQKEPSAKQHKEPSAKQHKEPSAEQQKEPSAEQHKEPSAKQHKEPSAQQQEKPSAQKEPSAQDETPAPSEISPAAPAKPSVENAPPNARAAREDSAAPTATQPLTPADTSDGAGAPQHDEDIRVAEPSLREPATGALASREPPAEPVSAEGSPERHTASRT